MPESGSVDVVALVTDDHLQQKEDTVLKVQVYNGTDFKISEVTAKPKLRGPQPWDETTPEDLSKTRTTGRKVSLETESGDPLELLSFDQIDANSWSELREGRIKTRSEPPIGEYLIAFDLSYKIATDVGGREGVTFRVVED